MAIGNVNNVNLVVKDANQASQNIRTNQFASDNALAGISIICDPASGYGASVEQFHASDNQAPGATAYGILVGNVAQLVNVAGNLDRQREVSSDDVPASGVAMTMGMRAMHFQVGTNTAVAAAGAATITLTGTTGLTGLSHGVTWKIQVGDVLIYDQGGANEELIEVTAVNAATPSITAIFANTHAASVTVIGYTYQQSRDAIGVNDGGSGKGTTPSVEYFFNAGGPGGVSNFDRARNIMGKGIATASLSGYAGATRNASLTLSGAPPATGPGSLQPGMLILLYGAAGITGTSAQVEAAYVGLGYVPGSTTVPIVCGTKAAPGTINAYAYTTIAWDSFSAQSPGTSGFLPAGIGLLAQALFNSVDGKMYLPRIAAGNPGAMLVSSDGYKDTYRYAVQGFSPVATPTAFLVIQGSATKTVRIKQIKIMGVATAAGNMPIQASRWSSAGTVGSAVLAAVNPVKHDTSDPAATAAVSTVGTANYTTQGTGNSALLMADRIQFSAAGSGVAANPVTLDFSTRQDKAFVLRGTSDYLVLSGAGGAVPAGGVIDITIEMEEDDS
jgi:hypothetical protein